MVDGIYDESFELSEPLSLPDATGDDRDDGEPTFEDLEDPGLGLDDSFDDDLSDDLSWDDETDSDAGPDGGAYNDSDESAEG